MALRFPRLATALAEFDRTAPERRALWENASTDADVLVAETAERDAWHLVCLAFIADDRNPNSDENSMLLKPTHARLLAKDHLEPEEPQLGDVYHHNGVHWLLVHFKRGDPGAVFQVPVDAEERMDDHGVVIPYQGRLVARCGIGSWAPTRVWQGLERVTTIEAGLELVQHRVAELAAGQ